MSDSYVTSGAILRCSFGDRTSRLSIFPDRTVYLTGNPWGNISDHIPLRNIHPFGKCHTICFPPTGAATAAAHGHLTPMPCIPGTIYEWLRGKNDVLIKGKPALLQSSVCRCQYGGLITVVANGQDGNSIIEEDERSKRETEEEIKKKSDEKNHVDPDAVLDGIQILLDGLGFVPILGAAPDLLNASISACRGDWVSAGISLVSAVPGIGDAVGGTKIARKAYKIAKKTHKVTDEKIVKISQAKIATSPQTPVTKTSQGDVIDMQSYKRGKGLADKDNSNIIFLDEKRSDLSIPKTSAGSSFKSEHEVIKVRIVKTEGEKQVNGVTLEGKTSFEVIGRESDNTIYNSTSDGIVPIQPVSPITNTGFNNGNPNGQGNYPKDQGKEHGSESGKGFGEGEGFGGGDAFVKNKDKDPKIPENEENIFLNNNNKEKEHYFPGYGSKDNTSSSVEKAEFGKILLNKKNKSVNKKGKKAEFGKILLNKKNKSVNKKGKKVEFGKILLNKKNKSVE